MRKRDYSVFHTIKLSTMEVVAEYQGKVTPDVFSDILYNSGKEYGSCMMVVENNSVGFAVVDCCHTLAAQGHPKFSRLLNN